MITNSYDCHSEAIINPPICEDAPKVDACILTFSRVIEQSVLENYPCEKIGSIWFATGETPVYRFTYKDKVFAFYMTHVGAPACVGTIEDSRAVLQTKRYVLFGGAGCLNKEIARGKVMIPTEAYRDEGTSYHYAPAADYIRIPNANRVAAFMELQGIPYVLGKTWTTDSFYRETVNHFQEHKADGCISVEMEGSAAQAVCDFRGLELYMFYTGGDLLDAPKWDQRYQVGERKGTQHDVGHFDIALELAYYVSSEA